VFLFAPQAPHNRYCIVSRVVAMAPSPTRHSLTSSSPHSPAFNRMSDFLTSLPTNHPSSSIEKALPAPHSNGRVPSAASAVLPSAPMAASLPPPSVRAWGGGVRGLIDGKVSLFNAGAAYEDDGFVCAGFIRAASGKRERLEILYPSC
jgi:hypothetical protein